MGPSRRTRLPAKRHASLPRDFKERYLALFDRIDQGFCTIEVAFDDEKRPVDYRFLEVNPSFKRHTGILGAAGRWMRELEPWHEQHWLDAYGKVALTGDPARFEGFSTPLGKWWDVHAFRVGDPGLRQVAILLNDITDRKREIYDLGPGRDKPERRAEDRTAEIKGLFARLVTIQEQERNRIARDIHDQLGQHLTALRIGLQSLRELAWTLPPLAYEAGRVSNIAADLDRAIDLLTWDLRPEPLARLGLSAALELYVKEWSERFGIAAEYGSFGITRLDLPPGVEINLYRITQEALHNVVKHARASHVSVSLERRQPRIQLVIEDNGQGFSREPDNARSGTLGLIGMRERTGLINGELEIDTAPGRGTTIFVRLTVSELQAG